MIANLCIDLMFISPGILIQHDLNLRLKIKIEIHTRATTAVVVGSRMQRYCLFGDNAINWRANEDTDLRD
jgi:hypothetical protein